MSWVIKAIDNIYSKQVEQTYTLSPRILNLFQYSYDLYVMQQKCNMKKLVHNIVHQILPQKAPKNFKRKKIFFRCKNNNVNNKKGWNFLTL